MGAARTPIWQGEGQRSLAGCWQAGWDRSSRGRHPSSLFPSPKRVCFSPKALFFGVTSLR